MINDLDQISEYIVVFCHGGVFSVHLLYLLNQVASLKVEIAQNTFDYSFSLSFLFLSMFLSSSLSGTATPQNLIQSLRSPLPSSGEAMNGTLCLFLGSPVQEAWTQWRVCRYGLLWIFPNVFLKAALRDMMCATSA